MSTTIEIPAPPTHCPNCGAEYKNIQHPMKPLGVSMMRVCDCRPVTTTKDGVTATVLVSPGVTYPMSDRPAYDTVEGIKGYLEQGLDGLRKLAKDRNTAGYDRKERLHQFIILGRWMTDTCGNFGLTEITHPYAREDRPLAEHAAGRTLPPTLVKTPERRDAWFARALTSVIEWERLAEMFPELSVRTTMSGWPYPKEGEVCAECKQGWTLANAHDVEDTREKFFHRECYKLHLAREEVLYFRSVFEAAGYPEAVFNEIANGYYAGDPCMPPWFHVRTHIGVIEIGWRKRVINIDWSRCRFGNKDIAALFKDENVTVGETYVHAWGKEKAVEYLTKIRQTISTRDQEIPT